ncbi:MAG TPA: FAD-binding oxidoreductase [Solirubrobacterales bacterium]|nr:FAD-binding oxidoreductase [Solirubrobacterales bacterium]
MTDFTGLAIAGRIATPDDADWDEARAAWNLAADQRPEAVVFAGGAEDVAATVRFAAANGLRVAAQGTGHGAAPLAALEGTILLKTERMRGISVDPGTRTARVEAGALSIELGEAANEHGLCSLPGSSPDVGVTGYTLGGGLSWLGRRYGFACNRVAAIELVDAGGEPRTVDAENEADLFWALRGGGGGYAIVTALRVELLPIAEVYAGALLFPAEAGAEAVRAYRDWAAAVPDEVTSVVRFVTPPPIPDVPEPLRGTPLLTIDAACIGGQAEGEATIAPLREIGEPIMDTFEWMPTAGLSRIHMDPESPVPGIGEGMTIADLPDEAIDAFVAVAGPDSGSPLLLSELRHLGGALGRSAEGAGALSHLDAGFVMYSVGMPMTPELGEAIPAHLKTIEEAMRPWGAEGRYYNFAEGPCDVDAILPPGVCDRLGEVKRKWDPDGRIVANHAVVPAEA